MSRLGQWSTQVAACLIVFLVMPAMAITTFVANILPLVNLAEGVVATIWLLIAGQWKLLLAGLFIPVLAFKTLLPWFTAPLGAALVSQGNAHAHGEYTRLTHALAILLGALWFALFAAAWYASTLVFFATRVPTPLAIPLALLCYGVANGPFALLISSIHDEKVFPLFIVNLNLGELVALAMLFRGSHHLVSALVVILAAAAIGTVESTVMLILDGESPVLDRTNQILRHLMFTNPR